MPPPVSPDLHADAENHPARVHRDDTGRGTRYRAAVCLVLPDIDVSD